MIQKILLDRLEALVKIATDKDVGEISVNQLSKDELKSIKEGAKEAAKSEKKGEPIASIFELWFSLGKLAHNIQLFKEAEIYYRVAIAHKPSLSDAWYYLGLLMYAKGLNEKAQEMFKTALDYASPKWNKLDRAKTLVQNILTKTTRMCACCGTGTGQLPFVCFYCGREYCVNHRLPEKHHCTGPYRVTILREKQLPTDPILIINELHRIGNAAAEKMWINVSSSDVLESDFEILKSAHRKLVADEFKSFHQANDFNLWFRTAKVAHCFHFMEIAEEFYKKALDYKTNLEICENLGLVLKARRKWVEAETWIRKLIALDKEYTTAWMNLGEVLDSQNRKEEAKLAFETAFRLDPRKIEKLIGDPRWSYIFPKERNYIL